MELLVAFAVILGIVLAVLCFADDFSTIGPDMDQEID
jgi:hypothetical protein